MAKRRALSVLLILTLLLIVACGERPAADPGPNIDLSDPDVGGSAGSDDGPQTPVPTPTPTREASPRLDATGEALATFPAASPTLAPTAGQSVPPTETPSAPEPTAEPTAEPLTEPTAEPTSEQAATPASGTVNEAGEVIHIVQPGETLYRIGLQYGLSWVVIAEYNGITNPDAISAGQELRIPPAPPEATAEPTTESRAPADEPAASIVEAETAAVAPLSLVEGTHTVAAGKSLYRIAHRYGISWEQVAEANGLAALNQISAGQVLKIPADVPGSTPDFAYQVRPGDMPAAIARQTDLTTADLAAANALSAPCVTYPGQTIAIPGR